jgi:ribonuclease G
VIEQTEALISIDVNTAGFLGTKNLEETAFITNMEAAASIPRQLRLRNLGGIIVIDFIDMQDPGHQEAVLAKLQEALDRDPAKSQVEGFSFLGLVQLSRKRTRESLVQVMCDGCSHCNGSGYVKTAESTCMEIFRAIAAEHGAPEGDLSATLAASDAGAYVLTSNATVVERLLDEEAPVYQALAAKLGHDIRLEVDSAYGYDQFDLVFVPVRTG